MLPRFVLVGLVLAALPAGAVVASQRAADALGRTLGRDAALALAGVRLFPRSAEAPAEPGPTQEIRAEAIAMAPVITAGTRQATRSQRGKKAQPEAVSGVFVSASTVLALASRGVVPRGVPVEASGARPAGLRLVGVGALGVGLRDGDVLTSVLGAPAASFAAVVSAVVQARARHARVISGEFWRDGRGHPLSVEQPYAASAPTGGSVAPSP